MSKTIILLEDQDNIRRSLAHLLKAEVHTVRVARNDLEAQAQCAGIDPDVALVDIELPGVQGSEWALYLKEMSPNTRIIFISGKPGLAGLDRSGPDVHFMHKPVVVDDLLDLINAEPALAARS